jgi:hypothetical protein
MLNTDRIITWGDETRQKIRGDLDKKEKTDPGVKGLNERRMRMSAIRTNMRQASK